MIRRFFEVTSPPIRAFLDTVLAVLAGTLVVDVLLGVVSRYFWGAQIEWSEELACYLLIWIGLLGAAGAFARNAHLGLDILVTSLAPNTKIKARWVSGCICLAFTILVFLFGGGGVVLQAFATNRISPALQLPDGFVFLSLPVSGAFMFYFQLANLIVPPPTKTDQESVEIAEPHRSPEKGGKS
jgi:TRAP-type C4-dicarboxylate transport system permease small subunit